MKNAIIAILAAALVGCASNPEQQQQTCQAAGATLAAYQAYLIAQREPDPQQVAAAQAATAFLTSYCGWTATRGVDSHGVPIILPPQ